MIGALQGAATVAAGLSLTKPADLLIRTLVTLGFEALVYAAAILYVRRRADRREVAPARGSSLRV